ncbi:MULTISPECIES: LysR family transcriptional regulator [unclassified Rhizobium]|uniref:LysR family transcriptional regulator n=1 Tax=unclassified Rhizobium TaxID=2613769 RepID=UPI001A986C4A|nr:MULTISPECIES: LysR family transcriptional regulator [unclassified Rhizobium]MBX5170692.1 LysR family transcriptional regulator [Rhizobium sp. NZLR1b]MBX5181470.1 LysR family transcriptional regulator [Rhizobium sp. NZLR5]MBX5196438.1 LysR family transcriptional regulator [Rhizobium sp. NZLR10]MBX5200830.1 LysR family transcriptional regulator [Rhizobium sp. NZLR1]QSZ21730.1 LysR family transcriptional regulator [Rhizobium sp. NZLR1]
MRREELGDLMAFLAVAEEKSFTRAAARLGTSQSSLSLIIKRLEERLGVRLLTRTTRSLAPTDAGEQLLSTLAPALGTIEARLAALSEFRDKPAGSFRITAGQHAIDTILWPKLSAFLRHYPDIKVELVAESALTDIVAERFDAGVRLGDQVEKDMIAVRIGPLARMIVVAAPSCFKDQPPPSSPQDLTAHRCINIRLPSYGGFYPWEFERDGHEVRVRVDGQVAFNGVPQIVKAALDGYGLTYVHEDVVREDLENGRLVQVLDDWSPPFPGYHLYYPSRRHSSPAFTLLVEALRHHD